MHFAALSLVGESMQQPLRYYRNNVAGALALLEACEAAGVQRFVLSSTAAVYGTPSSVPIPETAELRPESVYGETKLAVERLLHWLSVTKGLGYAALRYFNAAGAAPGRGEDHRPETHLIPLVLQAALGKRDGVRVFGTDYPTADGTAVRDYVHVEDLAEAHVLALEALRPGRGDAYNLGNGAGFSVRQVIEVCRAVTGADLRDQTALKARIEAAFEEAMGPVLDEVLTGLDEKVFAVGELIEELVQKYRDGNLTHQETLEVRLIQLTLALFEGALDEIPTESSELLQLREALQDAGVPMLE